MSDHLTAAASALDLPEGLVQRSAAARATASGTSVEDVLAAWAGGAPMSSTAPVESQEATPVETQAASEPEGEPLSPETTSPEPASPETASPGTGTPGTGTPGVGTMVTEAPEAIITEGPGAAVTEAPEAMVTEAPEAMVTEAPEPEKRLEPVPLGRRVRTAVRVGAWTGAGLDLIGFVVATASWAATATVTGEGPFIPVIQVNSNSVIIGAVLVSLVFGAISASLSRFGAAWANPGMQLSASPASTAWLGAFIGLFLGVIAGAALTSGFAVPVEGVEGVVQLPVLATMGVMLFGGAILGGATAAVTQALGVPVSVPDEDHDEVAMVRRRLRAAVGIPATGVILLLLLVLPFAWALIESNHLTSGGAAIVGTLTASGILGFAALAGTRPNVRLTFGEVMVALAGIGTVLVVILVVLFAMSPDEDHEEPAVEPEAAAVVVIG